MSSAFHFFALRAFPNVTRRPYVVPRQTKYDAADARDTAITWQESIRSGDLALERLDIEHDVLVKQSGRVPFYFDDGAAVVQRFDEFIATHHIEAFVTPMMNVLVMEAPGLIVRDAYRTLRDFAGDILIAERRLAFAELAPKLAGVRGAWFSRNAGPVVKQALFGPAIRDSPEWTEANLKSDISSLIVNHLFEDEIRSVMITRNATIVVYQEMERLQLLRLVFDVYGTIMADALEEPDFGGNREAPRDLPRKGPRLVDDPPRA